MVEALERTAERTGFRDVRERREYSGNATRDTGYSTFAEMYLEKPTEMRVGLTASVCTWRGIPTIDDW
ncbi:MAG: hypothetical protein AABX26_01375 [Nanoarchaeota archaeon]